ncbi:MAG TPA: hypothetical protein VJN88_02205 [Ktedonobacterales bacterium]|nr:hypothetical protein [Ktedonobacterales bacterium]
MGSLPFSQPHAIVVGPDDNLWVPDEGGNRIWRITPAGVLTSFSIPAHAENPGGGYPYGIAAGPGGAVWFTEVTGMRIGRLTMDGHITEFKLPGVNHIPSDIIDGSDGAVWFLEPNQSAVGRITIGGQISEFALPHASCFSPGTQTASEYGDCQVEDLTLGSDGAVWFSEQWNQALGRMDEHGHVTEFRLPAALPLSGPTALTSGPDGALWFVYDRGVARWSL